MGRSHSRQHDHEFLGEDPEEISIDFDGEYINLYERCDYRPTTKVYSGGEFEDDYYEEGPRCEAQRTTYLKMEATTPDDPNPDPDLWTDVVWRNRDDVEAYVMGHFLGWNADREGSFTLIYDDVEYHIDIAVDEQKVST